MGKKIRFKYKEIEDLNKVIVYIDYIDRWFFNESYIERWKYRDIDFYISIYKRIKRGCLNIDYDNNKLCKFEFYIGTEKIFLL